MSIHSTAMPAGVKASVAAAALLCITLFLLSADHVHVLVAGNKVKLGYFCVASLWLTRPRAMAMAAATGLRGVPRWPLLIAVPIAIAVVTSVNVTRSLLWASWLVFDVVTILTVYAYLVAQRFTTRQIANTVACALALIVIGALAQFVAIYFMNQVVLAPQKHFDLYRINGLAGWPHFLCIFSFLLLPIVATEERLTWPHMVVLALAMFVLVQSTAKTGWVLFTALGALMLWFDQQTFRRNYLFFLLPITIIALLMPVPAPEKGAPALTGGDKVHMFSEDLDLSSKTTSGTDRVLISEMGLAVWWRHPWFGVGPKAYDTYVFSRFDSEMAGHNKFDANGAINAKNENIWVEWLAECGVFFTLLAAAIVARALWVPGFAFRNHVHFGAWLALVLYFALSGQVSQNGLLTMVYAVAGIYFRARELPRVAKSRVYTRDEQRLPLLSRAPLSSNTRPGT